ncbi:MAG: hypothetical protein M1839_003059 [Geoglossum umbratile]|nr:MAG: hypothetical protein M1839_003059 [Geoglossum umbratile]
MVLDPFSALGVAGNIVQFVDFTGRLFSKSRELYRSTSGTTAENEELGRVTRELQALCAGLASATRIPPESARRGINDAALRELSKSCRRPSQAMAELLSGLTDSVEASWLKNLSNWPPEMQFECLKLLMLHGANPKVKLKNRWQPRTLKPRVDESHSKRPDILDQLRLEDLQLCGLIKKIFPPNDATELLDIMSPGRLAFLGWAGWKKAYD